MQPCERVDFHFSKVNIHNQQMKKLGGQIMTNEMSASWRKMVGVALLWTSFATLVYLTNSSADSKAIFVAVYGFFAFAAGVAFFENGMKRARLQPRV
jgi:hypothetical protein